MLDVFERELDAEWKRRGRWGIFRAGCRAAGELFTVAIPGHLMSDWVITAGLSLVLNAGILGLLVGLMTDRSMHFRPHHH